MRKHFILGIMALAALASCTKSEVLNQESLQEKGISFSVYSGKSVQTKTTSISGNEIEEAGIGVLAWRTGNEESSDAKLTAEAPTFMPNILLTWDGTTGTYAPMRYWPSTGAKISFYAYAPYSDQQGNSNEYHPENIKISEFANISAAGTGVGGQHVLTLTVPKDGDNPATDGTVETDYNSGNEYANHTDFLVSRKGNATDANDPIGYNQNLNKDFDGKVKLQMKHALSKISFVAKAGNQTNAYVDTRVIIEDIQINGKFANEGSYNLFTEKWSVAQSNYHEQYQYVNMVDDSKMTGYTANVDNDPFTAIADELYNNNGTEVTGMAGWYYLTDPSYDMMLIPFTYDATTADNMTPAKITNITGKYKVVSYDHNTGEKLTDPAYTDVVDFDVDVNLELEEGKSYIFKLNISLKAIEFDVDVEDWAEATEIDITHSVITKSYVCNATNEDEFKAQLPESYWSTHPWDANTAATLPWLVVEITPTPVNELDITVEAPDGYVANNQVLTTNGFSDFTSTNKVTLLTFNATELGHEITTGTWKVTINNKTTFIEVL